MKTLQETNKEIEQTFNSIRDKVIQKNIDYNNSLQNPISIFHKETSINGILARIDDKLNRIHTKGIDDKTEDTIEDLIGYLIHLKIAQKND
jgi:hypothetical protein